MSGKRHSGTNIQRLFEKNKQSDNQGTRQFLPHNDQPGRVFKGLKKLVRIDYPGEVKNVERAIDTLGGIKGIQKAVYENKTKLELRFHPKNPINKACVADQDSNSGILLKIRKKPSSGNPTSSKINELQQSDYDIVGITTINYKFNRLCDFQYLPLLANMPECEDSDVIYLHEQIFPDNLPNIEWLHKPENASMPLCFTPSSYARFDSSNNRLYLNTGEKYGTIRPEITNSIQTASQKPTKCISTRQISIFVNFQKHNVTVPIQPYTYVMELLKERGLLERHAELQKLFNEKPIWTLNAIIYKTTTFNYTTAKLLLPSVAYFCVKGPWRMCWIRYGYNPQKEFASRLYQTLDYRIPTEGTIKVMAKRSYSCRSIFYSEPSEQQKISLDKLIISKKDTIEERNFVLRPTSIPTARQMFYQYCDVLIPEIQEMLSRLPKVPAGAKYDVKNGWLPDNFTEQCREIVNKYVLQNVQKELLNDSIRRQEASEETTSGGKLALKKGESDELTILDTIDLGDDDEEVVEQVNANDTIQIALPEILVDSSDEESSSYASDLDIDMEAVEEVNQMIANMEGNNKGDVEADVPLYLRK